MAGSRAGGMGYLHDFTQNKGQENGFLREQSYLPESAAPFPINSSSPPLPPLLDTPIHWYRFWSEVSRLGRDKTLGSSRSPPMATTGTTNYHLKCVGQGRGLVDNGGAQQATISKVIEEVCWEEEEAVCWRKEEEMREEHCG